MNGHALTFPIDLCIYDLGRKILSPNGNIHHYILIYVSDYGLLV